MSTDVQGMDYAEERTSFNSIEVSVEKHDLATFPNVDPEATA
eukprot:CAMPEP_0206273060 /NCGR_PEP_ID=MMETSP0047_2-20121206/34377_1 /ASSEMBLY_ACC=CAM_ASM_000192 /TAXON_ID=195065 /ORGANISM="Chroomonas mesostigmatica_cf, Strain CCMP1168" /LENGTH=41 /DNA_ID= /DNA_START= /DNA_END= /DNA_ORIENTATION=